MKQIILLALVVSTSISFALVNADGQSDTVPLKEDNNLAQVGQEKVLPRTQANPQQDGIKNDDHQSNVSNDKKRESSQLASAQIHAPEKSQSPAGNETPESQGSSEHKADISGALITEIRSLDVSNSSESKSANNADITSPQSDITAKQQHCKLDQSATDQSKNLKPIKEDKKQEQSSSVVDSKKKINETRNKRDTKEEEKKSKKKSNNKKEKNSKSKKGKNKNKSKNKNKNKTKTNVNN